MSTLHNNSNRFVYYRPISDVSSDLTIEVGSLSFSLHKVKEKTSLSDKLLHLKLSILRL